MPGFDVTRADSRRSRAVVALASLSVSALLLLGLTATRSAPTDAAMIDVTETALVELPVDIATADPTTEPVMIPLALSDAAIDDLFDLDPVELEHDAFMGCIDCPSLTRLEREVPRGGTLAGLLDDAGIDRVEAARAIASMSDVFDLRYLRAGQDISIYLEMVSPTETSETTSAAAELRLAGLSFRPDIERSITVARTWGDEYRARETIAEFDAEMVRASGTITASLYVDALEAGATDRVVVELAGVLAYAIDFQRSIRAGDEFDILFERFIDEEGDVARTGDILYASYDGRGDPKEFYRYETPDGIVGYYSPDGASAQRLLMLTPINGARLSSHFGRRRHPILGYTRAHNGTDFAAARGTPVLAAGNGIVERADRYGSFGNYVRIRHANGFQTAYAHLNSFARGVRAGTRVTQGQVVAYVGTTGRSTGPHLHYEVHQNGRPVNPMTLDLPTGRQLADDEIALFEAERDRIIAIRDSAISARAETPVVADSSNGAQ
jgi:murein DD-endopeptidase MepM/ murein hydrolase activator NlpD